jgi:methylmalonyl-CoA/ethylmalonyl-CoA epimerase
MRNSLFKNLIQVGIVVGNLKKAMENYSYKYGVKPWYVLKFSPHNVTEMYIDGKRKDYSMNIGVCSIGRVRFELIEPLDKSIYSDWYKKYGEGIIHHLKLKINNLDEASTNLKSHGVKVLQMGHQLGKNKSGKNMFNYLSTENYLGFILEIVNVTPDFIKPKPDCWYPKNEHNNLLLESIFKKPTQVGIVTKNLNQMIRNYSEIFGIKLQHNKNYNSQNLSNMYIHGKKKSYSMRIAFFKIGNVQIKLIEPYSDSIYTEFYEKYGEGVIHHLKMGVTNYEKTLEFFKFKKIKIIQSGIYQEKVRYSYLDTSRDINFITEIADTSAKLTPHNPEFYHP